MAWRITLAASCTHRRRGDRLVELIGFTKPGGKDLIKLLAKGLCSSGSGEACGEPQANHCGLTGADIDLVVRRDLGALLLGVHRVLMALHHAVVDAVLDVRALVLLPGKQPLVVGFVLGEEQRHLAFAGKDEFTQHRMRCRDRTRARRRLDLLEVRFLGGSVRFGDPRRPVVAEPQRRQQMQFGRFRSPVGRRDLHQDVFRTGFGVLHEDVEVAVVIEDAGVEEFILHLVAVAPAVRLHQVGVGKGRLRVLVEVLHVRVGRRAVEVEVVLLHILAVVALAVGQSEEPFLENRVLAVPQGQGEAELLLVVGDAGDAVLAPAIGPRAGLIVGEEIPGVAILAVVLAHRAPLPLAEVRAPFLPGDSRLAGVIQPLLLGAALEFRSRLRFILCHW